MPRKGRGTGRKKGSTSAGGTVEATPGGWSGSDSRYHSSPAGHSLEKSYSQTTLTGNGTLGIVRSESSATITTTTTALSGLSEHTRKWIDSLSSHCSFVRQESTDKGRMKYLLKCHHCEEKNCWSYDAQTFRKHLKACHHHLYQQDIEKEQAAVSSVLPSLKATVTKVKKKGDKYPLSSQQQKDFEARLFDFIVLDSVPFEIVDRIGFNLLIHHLNPNLTVPHSTTIARKLVPSIIKAKAELQRQLRGISGEHIHAITDAWLTRRVQSVLGVQIRFVNRNWEMKTMTAGFVHMPDKHTAANTRDLIDTVLKQYYLSVATVGSVTADNAANMIAAFKVASPTGITLYAESFPHSSQRYPTDEEESPEDYWEWMNAVVEQDGMEDFIPDNVEVEEVVSVGDANKHNGCIDHLLHLGVKNAVGCVPLIAAVVKKLRDVCVYMRRSPHSYQILRQLTGGLGLLMPCETRWNSWYYSCRRVIGKRKLKDGEKTMCQAITMVLAQAKLNKTTTRADPVSIDDLVDLEHEGGDVVETGTEDNMLNKASKVPVGFSEEEELVMTTIVDLFNPVCKISVEFQSSTITSSTVIPSILQCVYDIRKVVIPSAIGAEAVTGLTLFKKLLEDIILIRLGTPSDSPVVHPTTNAPWKIAHTNVFKNNNYVLAAILDPRQKSRVFSKVLKRLPDLANCLLTEKEANKLLEDEYELDNLVRNAEVSDESRPSQTEISSATIASVPSSSKKPKLSAFSFLEDDDAGDASGNKQRNEFEEYMKEELTLHSTCPLLYWKSKQEQFPILSNLARRYLSVPCTSSSIERLFSIAGSIIRARRASLKIETVEKILFCQQLLQSNILSKWWEDEFGD